MSDIIGNIAFFIKFGNWTDGVHLPFSYEDANE